MNRIGRRDFLTGMAAVGAGLTAGSRSRRAQAVTPAFENQGREGQRSGEHRGRRCR